MPFTEASKAIYAMGTAAGEGDMLTAALCAALLRSFRHTTFMEMFCPTGRKSRSSRTWRAESQRYGGRHIVMRSSNTPTASSRLP